MSIYLDKIKKISKISVSQVCRDLKVNRGNLLYGRSSKENEKKVYEELIKRYEDIKKV